MIKLLETHKEYCGRNPEEQMGNSSCVDTIHLEVNQNHCQRIVRRLANALASAVLELESKPASSIILHLYTGAVVALIS